MTRPFLPPVRHGILIDTIAIVANLFLFPYVLTSIGDLFDRSFADGSPAFMTLAGLMLFTLAARLFGLYLKRYPLQTHLEQRDEQTQFPTYFLFLNIGVIILNAAFVVVFLSAMAANLGLVEINYSGQPKDSPILALLGVLTMLAIMCAEAYLIFRLSFGLTKLEKELRAEGNWMFDGRGELAADFGLFSYMMVWQVFYNNTARLMMTPPENTPNTWEYRAFGAIFVFIIFLIFYVSPRTVFLIEDRKYPATWLFVFGVYVSSVVGNW